MGTKPKEVRESTEQQPSGISMIDELVANAKTALDQYMMMDQETIDHIVKHMALAGLDRHMELARLAVDETNRGVYEDQCIKNIFATEYVYQTRRKTRCFSDGDIRRSPLGEWFFFPRINR